MAARSKTISLVSTLALVLSAGLVHAADMPAEPAPVYSAVPAANWAGFYAGTLVGYGWTDADAQPSGGPEISGSFDGPTAGAVIGYNWQSGNWVYGLEGDITLHEIRGDVGRDNPAGTFAVDSLYSARIRGRVGYDFGRFLPYVAGGFATNETYTHIDSDLMPVALGDNQRMYGWTVGAGVDFKLGETFIGPVIIRAEYVYEDFSSETFDFGEIIGIPLKTDVEHSTHFARIGLISYLGDDTKPVFTGDTVDWSGAYGGLFAGYSRHNVDTRPADGGGDPLEIEADGALGGIYVGRNFQFGHVVLGWEGSIALADIEGSEDLAGAPFDYRSNIEADARVRIGYAFGRILPYVAAGVSWTRSEQSLDLGGIFPGLDVDPQRGRLPAVAWTVGAGVDYRLSDRFSLRAEYMYGRDDDAKAPDFGALVPVELEQEIEFHQVRFGTAYHF